MPDKVRSFIEKLAARTEQGKVSWERTADDGVYQASFPNYTVHVLTRHNPERRDETDYVLQIKDEDGAVIEDVSDETLSIRTGDPISKIMGAMFRQARRKALGVDKAVDAILSALGPDEALSDDDVRF